MQIRFRRSHLAAFTSAIALVAGCASGHTLQTATGATTTTAKATTTTVASGPTTTTGSPATTAKATTTTAKATTTTAASSGPVDPCTIVTKADAEAVANAKLQAGVKSGAADDASCTFAGDPNGPTAQLEVHVGPGAKKYLDIDKQLGHTIVAQSGLGDEAYVEDFVVFARKGTNWVAITLVRLDDFAPYKQKMLDLAKNIVAKL